MANITAVASKPAPGVEVFTWETITEADTPLSILVNGTDPLAANIQLIGTFGGATFLLQGSNNNSDWVTLTDVNGNALSFGAAGAADFSTSMVYLRVSASGGTSQDVDAILSMRG